MAQPRPLAPMIAPETATGAVRSPKTAELVAGTLRRMIVDGQLADGDFLPHEKELMQHFQVSRPTLRCARLCASWSPTGWSRSAEGREPVHACVFRGQKSWHARPAYFWNCRGQLWPMS